jgi:DNA modification methylase
MDATILTGDCLVRLRELDDESADACVTDPPYGLGFMGQSWDHAVPSADVWREVLRVLKPGAHLLAFAGTRTQHRMACAIEDAGFEIRDMIAWLYGSGFPKSKNLDGEWSGWGTALKPALEPITIARKPLRGTVAANVLAHGTGAINVEACRIKTTDSLNGGAYSNTEKDLTRASSYALRSSCAKFIEPSGRWPANVCHDGSEEPEALLGEAARFFYSAKADAEDRNEGLPARVRNRHPTVKPVDLMRYLCRLVTRPGGLVLDPFMGSGSTGKACALEGFNFIGCELDPAHVEVAQMRIEHAGGLFAKVSVR